MLEATIRGHGPTVLLLHSSGMSSRQWKGLAEILEPTHRSVAPDFLGSGGNPPWAEPDRFDFREDVDAVEALAGDGPLHVVGHSYGGLVALTLAARRPERVCSISLYDPVAFGTLFDPDDPEGLADLDRAAKDPIFSDDARGGGEAWLETFVDYWNGPGAWRELSRGAREGFLGVGRKVFLEVRSLMADKTPARAYGAITAPALLLGGERSPPAAQSVVRRLANALPDARVEHVAGAGHMGPLTHKAIVNERIAAHVRSASTA